MKIYHNPRCSKSRQTLQLIREAGKEVQVIEYLKKLPTEAELRELIRCLGCTPEELIRKNEAIFKEKFKDNQYTQDEWIKIMVENPVLIERPIVVAGNKAVLGRPPENVFSLI